jgi:MoxR-like ATPase
MTMAALPMLERATSTASRPYYRPVGSEVQVFHYAYESRLPLLLKGPTGCGKSRFVEAMAAAPSSTSTRSRRRART